MKTSSSTLLLSYVNNSGKYIWIVFFFYFQNFLSKLKGGQIFFSDETFFSFLICLFSNVQKINCVRMFQLLPPLSITTQYLLPTYFLPAIGNVYIIMFTLKTRPASITSYIEFI